MNFITQYLLANSGLMVSRSFTIWGGLFCLSVACGRKVFTDMEHYILRTQLYIAFIGNPGVIKSVPRNAATKLCKKAKLDVPFGAGSGSFSALVKLLTKDDCLRTYLDEHGQLHEIRQIILSIDELKNFLGNVAPEEMCDGLTAIYDQDDYEYLTHKHGHLIIKHPVINFIACAQPDWFPEYFRKGYFSGGFGRRVNMIYVTKPEPKITFPKKTKEAFEAEEWCAKHLQKIHKMPGSFTWTDEAREYFDKWFQNLPVQTNKLMASVYQNKDCMAIRISMLLQMAEEEPKFVHTVESLTTAIALLDALEDTLPQLTIAAGRNELMRYEQEVLSTLEKNGGAMPEPVFHRIAKYDLSEREYQEMLRSLLATGQLKEMQDPKTNVRYVATPEKYREIVKLSSQVSTPSSEPPSGPTPPAS